ncbi:MAG: T9SS type A sorting domain-containing protein [bacterium]
MKRSIYLLLFIFALTINALGQEYTAFPTKNAFWSAMHCEPGTFVPKSGLVKVSVLGDTLINTKTYHKLYLQRKYVNTNPSCDTCGFVFDIDSAFYFMSYREEAKIIYFVPQQNGFGDPGGTEYPVFNFNLTSVGEKIVGYEYVFIPFGTSYNPIPTAGCGSMQDTVTLTVKSIDRVMMSDGSYRRRINFEPLTYGREESWIEGVGSTKGFGFSLDITNSNNSMVCFSHDGVNLETSEILGAQLCNLMPDAMLNYENKCEYTAPSAIDESRENSDITVFPNPVNQCFNIKGLIPGDKFCIYTVLGQIIYGETAEFNELIFDKFDFDQGIYIYTVITADNDVLCGKIIKQ